MAPMAGRPRKGAWAKVEAKLPGYLEALLASEAFGRGPGRKPPPREHGVYLFTEAGKHLYVGRCGLTERAANSAEGKGHSNFRTRLAGHTRPSSAHNQASFAWRLAVKAVDGRFEGLPTTRAALERDSRFRQKFARQKERVTAMDFRVVTITDNFESYVFEPYAALMLGTPHNSWATS
jgi:hypothetical protein